MNQRTLKMLVKYEPKTGGFLRLTGKFKNRYVGAGSSGGYVQVRLEGKSYLAHRLAWLYMTGEWPKKDIDHIDGERYNNKWNNLRLASRSENARNRNMRVTNTTGYKGVSRNRRTNKYYATIKVKGKSKYLGSFKTPEEAYQAYVTAADKYYGEFANHGDENKFDHNQQVVRAFLSIGKTMDQIERDEITDEDINRALG